MSLSIQAPSFATPAIVCLMNWAARVNTWHKMRHVHAEAVRRLRTLDPNLLHDIDVDREALWQPRPEIRLLHSAHLAAIGHCDGDRAQQRF